MLSKGVGSFDERYEEGDELYVLEVWWWSDECVTAAACESEDRTSCLLSSGGPPC